jgi:hypothetical protein
MFTLREIFYNEKLRLSFSLEGQGRFSPIRPATTKTLARMLNPLQQGRNTAEMLRPFLAAGWLRGRLFRPDLSGIRYIT